MVSLFRLAVLAFLLFLPAVAPFTTHSEFPSAPTKQATSPILKWVSHLGGAPDDFTVHASYLYMSMNGQIKVVDISDPTAPQIVGETPIIGSDAFELMELTWVNGYLYTGFAIFDVRTPTQPVFVREFYLNGIKVIEGTRLYAHTLPAFSSCYLNVYDISNPALPLPLASNIYAGDEGACVGIADVEGNLMVLEEMPMRPSASELLLMDVTNLEAPITLSTISIPQWHRAIDAQIVGDSLYVATNSWSGNQSPHLAIYDIQEVGTPTIVAELAEPVGDFTLENERLYVRENRGELYEAQFISTWDVENPLQPVKLGDYELPNRPIYRFSIQAGLEYRLDHDTLQIRELSDPDAPTLHSELRGWHAAEGTGKDGYLFALDPDLVHEQVNLQVIDARDATTPLLVQTLSIAGYADTNVIHLQENTLYWGSERGLKIINIANPLSPTLIYEAALIRPHAMLVEGTVLYALTKPDNESYLLNLVDVANPAAPTLLSTLEMPLTWDSLAIKGNMLYVGSSPAIVMVDVANPNAPIIKGTVGESPYWGKIKIEDDRLYLLDTQGDLLSLYDLTTPEAPEFLATYPLPQASTLGVVDYDVVGNLLYVSYYDGTIVTLDVANPQTIQFLHLYNEHLMYGGKPYGAGEYLYHFAYDGVDILQCTDRNRLTLFLPQLSRAP